MSFFRLIETVTPYSVDKDTFDTVTQRVYPYVQKSGQYALCTQCRNPVQFIGLYKTEVSETGETRKIIRPYVKHTGKSISGFPEWNQQNYYYCPNASHARHLSLSKTERALETDLHREIHDVVREHFPEAAAAIRHVFGIYYSNAEMKEFLSEYATAESWQYPLGSVGNIPYMLVYLAENRNAYMRGIRIGSPIYNAIKKCKEIAFVVPKTNDNGNFGKYYRCIKPKCYMQIAFTVILHRRFADKNTGNVIETLRVNLLNVSSDAIPADRILASAKLNIDETYFPNLIASNAGNRIREMNTDLDAFAKSILSESLLSSRSN